MKTILVGGCSANVGKTTVVCRILEVLPGWGALKISPVQPHPCGGANCRECHGMEGDRSLLIDTAGPEGSGTSRYGRAGASRTGWLRAREDVLGHAIQEALARFDDLPGLVVEGNSFARHGAPDRIVLVARAGVAEVKPSARDLLPVADWLVLNCPAGVDREVLRAARARLLREVLVLDATSREDGATAAFLAEVRAWARR